MFSGGALHRFSLFALNVMPYISASIIVQLLVQIVPSLKAIQKEGESGRRKINQWSRMGAIPLAVFQAWGIAAGAAVELAPHGMPVVYAPGMGFIADRGDRVDRGHDVPDVAGRADHRARYRQRRLADHLRRHRGGPAGAAVLRMFEQIRNGDMNAIVGHRDRRRGRSASPIWWCSSSAASAGSR